MNKVTLLELNEFNKELLENAAIEFNFPSIKKMVEMTATSTLTNDTYSSDFLEPWVQWVSVHTGTPSDIHKIKHLGDVPDLERPQLWELLSDKGISSGIWGAMNASKASASLCSFFMPDPWTESEKAYPEELNALLDPLRLVSKNYLNPDKKTVLKLVGKLKDLFKSKALIKEIIKEIPRLLKGLIEFKGAHFVFIAFVEYVSVRLFLRYKDQCKPDFSLLFINTLAHIQHHHWHGTEYKNNKKLRFGLEYIDKSLGFIFQSLDKDEHLIVTNALSQKNTNDEEPWILYRPLSHKAFLNASGLFPKKIEEHMTHDAHLYFSSEKECSEAFRVLKEVKINQKPLFFIESYQEDPLKLFYRLEFTDPISNKEQVTINSKKLDFLKYYQAIVERTGKHIPTGTIYSNTPLFPEKIKNHEINDFILKLFNFKQIDLSCLNELAR